MEYVWFLASGCIVGLLLGQVMKSGEIELIEGLTVGVVGVLLGGFVFPRVGITTSEWVMGLIYFISGALSFIFITRLAYSLRGYTR